MSAHGSQDSNDAAQDRRLSRRAFLGAAGAAGSAAALGGVLGSGRAVAATGRPLARAYRGRAAAQGTRGFVGSTVQTAVYPHANDRYGAATIFDQYVNRPAAEITQKWYFNEGEWPTPSPSDPSGIPDDMTQLAKAGCKFIMCFKPIRSPMTQGERNNLAAACNLFTGARIKFDVVLWQECNTPKKGYFPNANAYQDYVGYYQQSVPAGIDIIYDSAGSADSQDQQDYFPGSSLVDKVYCDFYGDAYAAKLSQGIQSPLAAIEAVADNHGLPLGLGEWGYGLSAASALTPSTKPYNADEFVGYINTVFTKRLSKGEVNGAVVYYDGDSSNTPWNVVMGAGDWKTKLFQQIYDSLAPA
jgi:hypothetical protein